jgi:hypothetical protein
VLRLNPRSKRGLGVSSLRSQAVCPPERPGRWTGTGFAGPLVGTSPVGSLPVTGLRCRHRRWPGSRNPHLHTADPVHLVRVFGITESTAVNYVHAAHPGRQAVIPR